MPSPRRATANRPTFDQEAQELALALLSSECGVCRGGTRSLDRLSRTEERRRWIREQPSHWAASLTSAGPALARTRRLLRAYLDEAGGARAAKGFQEKLGRGLLRPQLSDGSVVVLEPSRQSRSDASWVVTWGLASLLSTHPGRVRRCNLPPCGCYFVDTSRSGRRRWCAMALCGNRAKARRHYLKARR
jgi:predicted RNA-binding Zn ribbon-like protein